MAQRICTDEKFVEAWQAADNVADVAEATGLAVSTCQTKAADLRKALKEANLPTLKTMAKGRTAKKRDLAALAALIQPAVEDKEDEGDDANTEMEAS